MKSFNRSFFSLVFMATAGFMGSEVTLAAADAAPAQGYHVIESVPLPGDGGFDFLTVDSDNRRVYITHNDSVQVLDADTMKLVGTVEKVPHPHGVAFLPVLGKGYATSGDPGSVVVFDLKTFKHLAEIPTAKDSDVVIYDKSSGKVLTFNGDSENSTVIDPATDKVVTTMDLGGGAGSGRIRREGPYLR